MKVGAIVNPNAKGVIKGYSRKVKAILKTDLVFETSDEKEIKPALQILKAEEPDILSIIGGDGTVGATVTELLKLCNEQTQIPILLPARAGTLNVIADNIPVKGDLESILLKLKEFAGKIRFSRDIPRDNIRKFKIIKVKTNILEEERYGFSIDIGIPFFFTEKFYQLRTRSSRTALTLLSKSISKFVMGMNSKELARSFFGDIIIDGVGYPYKEHLLIVASVFKQLPLFFRPFYVKDDKWKDGFYFWVLSEDIWNAMKNFRVISRGLKRMRKSFNDIAENVTVVTKEGFALDGELFKPPQGEEYSINITLGPVVDFLKL